MASNYEKDFYGWTQEQAKLLKSKEFNRIDLANIIEEIETLGRSEHRELEHRIAILLMHLLKWQFQSQRRSNSWKLTIDEQRLQFIKVLKENPGLKPKLNQIIYDAYKLALLKAARETGLNTESFPKVCPWNLNQLRDGEFYPD